MENVTYLNSIRTHKSLGSFNEIYCGIFVNALYILVWCAFRAPLKISLDVPKHPKPYRPQ